ncbi:MAG: M15 family metallopeptidase [Methylovulum sp.]|nr:M15 family metallopeptidase [Methylovulum sp.]
MTTLLTSQDCLTLIGEPIKERDMVLWDVPPELEIGTLPKRIYCNKRMVEPLSRAFAELIKTGEVKYLKTWDGCFNIRKKKGGGSYSLHSWGLAIDVNAAWNKYGIIPNLRPQTVRCFTRNGFDWGGEWKKPDGMHFQLEKALFKE